jgi:hypothetical protein
MTDSDRRPVNFQLMDSEERRDISDELYVSEYIDGRCQHELLDGLSLNGMLMYLRAERPEFAIPS